MEALHQAIQNLLAAERNDTGTVRDAHAVWNAAQTVVNLAYNETIHRISGEDESEHYKKIHLKLEENDRNNQMP
jgi:hypothetical protein